MSPIVHASMFSALCVLFAAPAVAADPYPERPIRLIVPFSPGGGTDINARILAGPIGDALGETIVVDNRPGAGSVLGSNIVAKATSDGYTLLLGTISLPSTLRSTRNCRSTLSRILPRSHGYRTSPVFSL